MDSKDAAKLDVFARVQAKKEEALRAEDAPPGARKKAVIEVGRDGWVPRLLGGDVLSGYEAGSLRSGPASRRIVLSRGHGWRRTLAIHRQHDSP